MARNNPPNDETVKIQVYLKTPREQELFNRIKEALGESDTGIFTYLLKRYAEDHNLVAEALHRK